MHLRTNLNVRVHGYAIAAIAALPLVMNAATLPATTAMTAMTAQKPSAKLVFHVDGAVEGGTITSLRASSVGGAASEAGDFGLPGETGQPSSVNVNAPKGQRTVTESPLGVHDIPATALQAYKRAALILADVDPACQIPWTLLAGIGRVESDHGRYGGASLGTDGVSSPLIIGLPLNGVGPVAAIRDSDGGLYDQDAVWDRAVGPMQFIPTTWAAAGVDGDGDGVRSPNDIDDAALATAVYLCAGTSGDVQTPATMRAALHRYNNSDSYATLVMAYERSYRTGNFTVSTPYSGTAPVMASGSGLDASTKAEATKAVGEVAKTGGKTDGISPDRENQPGSAHDSTGASAPGSSSNPAPDDTSGSNTSSTKPSGSSGTTGTTHQPSGSTTSQHGSTSGTSGKTGGTSGTSGTSGPTGTSGTTGGGTTGGGTGGGTGGTGTSDGTTDGAADGQSDGATDGTGTSDGTTDGAADGQSDGTAAPTEPPAPKEEPPADTPPADPTPDDTSTPPADEPTDDGSQTPPAPVTGVLLACDPDFCLDGNPLDLGAVDLTPDQLAALAGKQVSLVVDKSSTPWVVTQIS